MAEEVGELGGGGARPQRALLVVSNNSVPMRKRIGSQWREERSKVIRL